MSYMVWLTIFIWIPTIYFWLRFGKMLRKYLGVCVLAMIGSLIWSLPWDFLAVKNGIWYFPKGGHLGLYIGVLPLEEYLFITTVTFLIATITLVMKQGYKGNRGD